MLGQKQFVIDNFSSSPHISNQAYLQNVSVILNLWLLYMETNVVMYNSWSKLAMMSY